MKKDPNKTGNKQYSNYNEKKNSVGMVNGRLNTLAKENSWTRHRTEEIIQNVAQKDKEKPGSPTCRCIVE